MAPRPQCCRVQALIVATYTTAFSVASIAAKSAQRR
jgi:hypothetical protein